MTNRVDAAKKLRGSGDRLFGNSFGGGSAKATEIIRASIDVAYDYDELFDRLADLIDPKCYLEYREWIPSGGDECDLEWDWRCSNCNHDLMEHYEDLDVKTYTELGLLYCPHCGARIIGTRYGKDDDSER